MNGRPVRVVHTGHSEKVGLQSVTEIPAGSQARPTLIACTVATAAELPATKVLASSFLAHHPEGRFLALIVDALPEHSGPGLVTPADLGLPPEELAELATGCTAAQLGGLLRPRLLEQLLGQGVPVLYLDPWAHVLAPLTDVVLDAVARGPLVLLPRSLRPLPDDGLRPTQSELLDTGVFDPGFLVVAPGAEPFLRTLGDQLRRTPDATKAVLDTAPAQVNVQVLRDATIGLSSWNAAQRDLHRIEEGPVTVMGEPVRTVHFAGFDPQRPWLLSADFADRPRVLLSERPVLADLTAAYRAELVRHGHTPQHVPYGFGRLADGTRIPEGLRALYREEMRARPGSAFHPDGFSADETRPSAFGPDLAGWLIWACSPRPDAPGSTRWSAALWDEDEGLRAQFPDPFGADLSAFRDWCATTGTAGARLPSPAVPGPKAQAPALLDQLGVSVLGTGPLADLVRSAARASGLPTGDGVGYPIVLRVANSTPVPPDRYLVDFRTDAPSAPDAHELWVPSETSRVAFERPDVPVRTLPLPVPEADPVEREEREEVVFAAIADHATDRAGNVLGAVSAFLAAFPDRADVVLRIAVHGASEHPEAAERLRLATAADPRVQLVDQVDLTADCLVSLHRGGADDRIALALAHVAAHGVPIMVGDHGAVAELFDKSSVVFVPCRQGVEPDVQAAVKLLRALADDLPTAHAIGAAGRERIRSTRALDQIGDLLRDRVEHAYRSWRARRAAQNPAPAVDPLKALHSAKHALLREPDVTKSSRTPMAPQLRKVVLRVLDHYDNHMRDVLTSLVDGVERTVSEVVRRQDEVSGGIGMGELEVLRNEVEHHAERQEQVYAQVLGLDDGVVRVRADMAGQGRRLREIEDAVVSEAGKHAKQADALTQRIDKLAVALERTLDRIDSLESKVVEVLRERDTRLDVGIRAANQAQLTADALRRVVVREHERHAAAGVSVRSSLVLTDVGLLRLPADDAFMLPLLSSNGVWEPDLSELIDSVVEPDGIFLDVGAYVGYQTVRMLGRLGGLGAVVAVEPSPEALELLRHNVSVNLPASVADGLVVVDAAAWESVGEVATQPSLTGGLSVAPLPDGAAQDVARVRAARLDKELEAVPALQGRKLSVVRVDAPGRGHRALAGLVRLLRRDRPHVFLEFSATATESLGDDPVTVLKEFRIWGYDLVPVATREAADPEQIVAAMEGLRSITLWLRPRPVAAKQSPPTVAVPLRQPADQAI
ncbi:FkbM family methyltransferase [Actinosynnema sp. NPDC020468]|uniref:FkbM family methyltransferase n=1 Tax=Actinosynnema sp. NPDC020468 TaxID=3154488 RepID=UPI0033F8427C